MVSVDFLSPFDAVFRPFLRQSRALLLKAWVCPEQTCRSPESPERSLSGSMMAQRLPRKVSVFLWGGLVQTVCVWCVCARSSVCAWLCVRDSIGSPQVGIGVPWRWSSPPESPAGIQRWASLPGPSASRRAWARAGSRDTRTGTASGSRAPPGPKPRGSPCLQKGSNKVKEVSRSETSRLTDELCIGEEVSLAWVVSGSYAECFAFILRVML